MLSPPTQRRVTRLFMLLFLSSIQVLVEKLSVNTTIDDDVAGCLEFLVQLPDQLIGIGV